LPERAALFMSVSPSIQQLVEYRGIRSNRYTYVRNLAGPWLLFDNQTDPFQQHDLTDEPEQAGLRRDLDARLDAALKQAGDTFQPRQHYLDKWGYTLAPHAGVSYAPNAKVLSPRPQTAP